MIFVFTVCDLLKVHNQLICESLSDVDSANISYKFSMYQAFFKVHSYTDALSISFTFLVTL